jgi:hypothetical protein
MKAFDKESTSISQQSAANGHYKGSEKSKDRRFKGPVAWLLGPQLLNSAKGILLYLAYGKKLDPRDWMWADVFPSRDRAKALNVWRLLQEGEPEKAELAAAANPYDLHKEKEKDDHFWQNEGEFWFDYISDTGDGMKATYSIAYLCLSDLYVNSLDPSRLAAGAPARTCWTKAKDPAATECLPRGAFLFIGGDTAYHVSDYLTLGDRVQAPFQWAYRDLADDLLQSKDPIDLKKQPNRPIFGIPGNHDYYDQLDGFRRQFRRSVRTRMEMLRGPLPDPPQQEGEDQEQKRLSKEPQLFLPGFNRKQQASYVALRLPFDWWFWGLDTEVGQIDERQRMFFRDLCENDSAPKKLIVATCSPTTAFGKVASPNDEKATDAFLQLGLKRPFLPEKCGGGGFETLNDLGDQKLDTGQCRLDISGDVHHYARYWGPNRANPNAKPVRKGATAPILAAKSYASIVSGIGGAFHHPSETYLDEIQEQAVYPSETESTAKVAQRLFNPVNIFRGGNVGLAGFLIAFALYFAATVPSSSKDFVNDLLSLLSQDFWTGMRQTALSILQPGPLLFLLSLAPLLYAVFGNALFGKASGGSKGKDQKVPVSHGDSNYVDPEIHARPEIRLWVLSTFSILTLFSGLRLIYLQYSEITPFGKSVVILLSITWAVLALSLSMRYSEFLFKKAHRDNIHWYHWSLTYVLTVFSGVSVAAALWRFGDSLRPAHLVSDMVFVLILLGAVLGMIILSIVGGGELFQSKRKRFDKETGRLHELWVRLRRGLVGLWHGVLQIASPFVLVRKGSILTWVVAALLMVAMGLLGGSLLKRNRRMALLFTWLCCGVLILALPYFLAPPISNFHEPFFSGDWSGWRWYLPKALVPPLAAGAFGLVMACVWLGWYLAVCFAFNGHNNEAGGAARIEEFKQFIRFRLTKDGLTGYVIGIDQPRDSQNRQNLNPEIIDCFHLRVKPAADSGVSVAD